MRRTNRQPRDLNEEFGFGGEPDTFKPSVSFAGTISEDLAPMADDIAAATATLLDTTEGGFLDAVRATADGGRVVVTIPGFATFEATFVITAVDAAYKDTK